MKKPENKGKKINPKSPETQKKNTKEKGEKIINSPKFMSTPKREKKQKVRRKAYLKRKCRKLSHRPVRRRIAEKDWRRKYSEQ